MYRFGGWIGGCKIGFGRTGGCVGAIVGDFSGSRDASSVSETTELALVSSLFFVSVLSSDFFCKIDSILKDFVVVGELSDFGFSTGA